jgi:hypothetical protein
MKIQSTDNNFVNTLILSILLLGRNVLIRNNKRLSIATTHTNHIQGILEKIFYRQASDMRIGIKMGSDQGGMGKQFFSVQDLQQLIVLYIIRYCRIRNCRRY